MNDLPISARILLAILSQHCAVLGKTGAGKSSLLRVIVEWLLSRNKRVVVVDPKGDWWGLKASADGKGPGFPIITFGAFKKSDAADVPINEHSGAHLAELICSGNRPCVIGLAGWRQSHMTRFWIDFASTLFRLQADEKTSGELYLVGDEFHNFAPKGKVLSPEAGECLHWSNRLLSEGRGLGLTILIASQRPQKVHNDTLTSCETLFAMRVIHKADREAYEAWIDGCGDPAVGNKVLSEVASMARGEAYVWSPEAGFGPERLRFPMFSTFDSFAPPQEQKKVHSKDWSTVDLDAVKQKLAAVIEDAKANDPKELKLKIAKLQQELKNQKPAAAAPAKTETIEVPVLSDKQLREFQQSSERIEKATAAIGERLTKYAEEMLCLDARQRALREYVEKLHGRPITTRPAVDARANVIPKTYGRDVSGLSATRHPVKSLLPSPPRASNQASPSNGTVSPAQQKILDALALFESLGVKETDKRQLALFIGASPNSSSYQNNMGALRSNGLLTYPSGGTAMLTDEGRGLARNTVTISTLTDLHAMWMSKLPGRQADIFRVLVAEPDRAFTNDELAAAVGVSPDSSSFQNNRGALRTLGVLDYPQAGMVRISQLVFPPLPA